MISGVVQEKREKEVLVFLFCGFTTDGFVLLCSQPTPGYFTDDQTLDFLLQIQDGVGMKKVKLCD